MLIVKLLLIKRAAIFSSIFYLEKGAPNAPLFILQKYQPNALLALVLHHTVYNFWSIGNRWFGSDRCCRVNEICRRGQSCVG